MATIVYNGYTLPNQIQKFSFQQDYETATLSVVFVIYGDDAADLITKCVAAESALRVRYKALTLSLAGEAEYNFSHTGNTGFLGIPKLEKLTDEWSTETSRAYRFSISMQLPADDLGYNYRRSANITLTQNVRNRKKVTVVGVYTAGGGDSASENWDDNGIAYCDAIAEDLLGSSNYELLENRTNKDQEDKLLNFTRVYQEKLTLVVSYNGYTIPSNYNLFSVQQSYHTFKVDVEFAIDPTNTNIDALAPLRQENADLEIEFDGDTQYEFKHSENTGMLGKPSLSQISNTAESDDLRFFRWSFTGQLPADASGYNFRREGSYSVSYDSSRRRTVTFSGLYTAGGADSALTKYQAAPGGGKSWATTVLTSLGGNYDLVSEKANPDHENKLCPFTLVYREYLTAKDADGTFVLDIVNPQCSYSVAFAQEAGRSDAYGDSTPAVTVSVTYSATIDNDLDPNDTDVQQIYETGVKPYIIQHSITTLNLSSYTTAGAQYITDRESFAIDIYNRKVSGQLTFTAPRTFSQILAVDEKITINTDYGIKRRKMADGRKYTYAVWGAGEEQVLRRVISIIQIGSKPPEPAVYTEVNKNWQRLTFGEVFSRKIRGAGPKIAGQNEVVVYLTTYIDSYFRYEAFSGSTLFNTEGGTGNLLEDQ